MIKKNLNDIQQINGQEDEFKTLKELTDEYGFQYEHHTITTNDGYILGIYRQLLIKHILFDTILKLLEKANVYILKIPGLKQEILSKKPVVLLQHALECDMMAWVFNKPEQAPAFLLVNAGYDVWLGNNRGNRFSDLHQKWDSKKDRQYWHFSWEEMGTYDIPSVIDYITKYTGNEKINYIGHSQGTTQLLAGASLKNEYFNQKINLAILLAPPVTMYNNKVSVLRELSKPNNMRVIQSTAEKINILNWFPYKFFVSDLASTICKFLDGRLCDFIGKVSNLIDTSIDDGSRINIYLSNLPSGASAFSYEHYGQLIQAEKDCFRRYDHGADENFKRYNQTTPTDYDLDRIQFPIGIFSGDSDDLADPIGMKWTANQLKKIQCSTSNII